MVTAGHKLQTLGGINEKQEQKNQVNGEEGGRGTGSADQQQYVLTAMRLVDQGPARGCRAWEMERETS